MARKGFLFGPFCDKPNDSALAGRLGHAARRLASVRSRCGLSSTGRQRSTRPPQTARLRDLHPRTGRSHVLRWTAASRTTFSAYISAGYAARQLPSDAVDETANPDLVGPTDDLGVWLADLVRER